MHWLMTLSWATDKTVAISGQAVFRPRCESPTSRMDRRSGCTALCSGSGSGGGSPNFHSAEPISPPRRSVWELNAEKSDAAVFLVNYHSSSVPCSVVCYHPVDGLSSTKTQIIPTNKWQVASKLISGKILCLSRLSFLCPAVLKPTEQILLP
jgi:hypothetical protein